MATRTQDATRGGIAGLALREWQRSALVVLAIMLLPFAIFAAEAAVLRVFYYHDIQYYFIPYHRLVVDIVQQGHLPLWNPYAFSGIPLLGDGQTAIFYPPNWLSFVLPPAAAINYTILLQFSLAGAGMFTFTRSLGVGRWAATLAAIAFMFNGFLATRMVHLSIMSGAALVPFVFWAVEQWRLRPGPARFALAALLVAVQALAGHPQVPVYTAAGVLVYLVVRAATSAPPTARWRAVLWAGAALVMAYTAGYCLAAIQLLPWIDFARLSPRASNASFNLVAGQSIIGYDWLLVLFPYIFGGVRTSIFHPEPPYLPAAIYVWERAAYVGILPLTLAAIALLTRDAEPATSGAQEGGATSLLARRSTVIALGAVLLVGVLIAGGRDTFVAQIVYATPVLGKLRAYSRAVVLLTFAVPALAAIGLQRMIELPRDQVLPYTLRRRLIWVAVGLIALFGIAVLALPPLLTGSANPGRVAMAARLSPSRATTYVPLIWAATTAGLLLWWSRFGVARRPILAIALVAADMIVFAVSFNPTAEPGEIEGTPPSVAFLQNDQTPFRTATFITEEKIPPSLARSQLAMSWSMVYGISNINGFNSLQPRRYTDLVFGSQVEDVSYGFLANNRLLQADSNILSMLNTKYLLVQPGVRARPGPDYRRVFTDETVTIYRNRKVYPRAYFVSELYTEDDPKKALSIVTHPTFDPRHEAVIEADLPEELLDHLVLPTASSRREEPSTQDALRVEESLNPDTAQDADKQRVVGQAAFRQVSPTHLQIDTQTDHDRFLVVSEMFAPGWQATIDGQPAPIYQANYVLRGLIVPAGKHTIQMVYRPASAVAGAGISGTMALLSLVMAIAGGRGWRPSPRRSRFVRALAGSGGRLRHRAASEPGLRSLLLVVAVLLFALVAYWPNRYFFRSTGDLSIYQDYARNLLATPRSYPREYPPLTAGLFVIPQLLVSNWYPMGFTLMAALAAAALVLLVDRLSRRGEHLLLLLFLGSFATLFFRYDIFVVLLTVGAYAAGTRKRWVLAQALLGLGVALKLYPALLLPLVVLWQWRDERRLPVRAAIAGGAALALAVASMILLSPAQFEQMVDYHGARPLEIESTGASIAWLLGSSTADFSFGSWNLLAPSAPGIITIMNGLTIAFLGALYAAYALGHFRAAAVWALVLMIAIATSKVFSTQYAIWALPFVVLATADETRRAWPRWLWIVICLLTGLIYPAGFTAFDAMLVERVTPDGLMAVVTLRNILWIAACVLAVRAWASHSTLRETVSGGDERQNLGKR